MNNPRFSILEGSFLSKLLLLLILLFFAYQFSVLSVYGLDKQAFVIVSFSLIVLLSYLFWQKAIIFFVFWIMISGAVRKWLLPQFSDIVFLFGHAILLGAYVRYFLYRLQDRLPLFLKHPVNLPIFILFFWGIICLFNPQLPNKLVGLLGLVIHFYFIPLAYILPYVIRTKEQLLRLLKIFAVISIPLLILGMVQFFSPPDSIINVYVSTTEVSDIALAGKYPRVTSTFSYLSGFASYLSVLILVLAYFFTAKRVDIKYLVLFYILMVLALMCLLMTGSRGPAIFTFIEVALYFLIVGFLNLRVFKQFLVRVLLLVLIVFVLFGLTDLGSKAVIAFNERLSRSEDIVPRLYGTFVSPFLFLKYVGPFGIGIGSTYQGAVVFGHEPLKFGLEKGVPGFEEEQGRVMLELGLVGYLLMYFIRFLFVKYFWDLFRKLKDYDLKLLALCSMLFILPFALGIPNLVFDHTTSAFFWYIAGFLFLLPILEKRKLKHVKT